MNALPAKLPPFIEAAADRIARAIATLQHEGRRERELREAEHRARMAELDARVASVAALERKVAERLAELKDGEPGKSVTVADVTPLLVRAVESLVPVSVDAAVAAYESRAGEALTVEFGRIRGEMELKLRAALSEAVASLPPAKDGKSIEPAEVEAMVATAVSALPPPAPGKDADPDLVASLISEKVAAAVASLPPPAKGDPGPAGALPLVKEWTDEVTYEGDVRTHKGATYQATKDTAKEPPHADWRCIAAAGVDGRSFEVRGTYVEGETYTRLDVVVLNGAAFVSRRDNPGPCPGDGWQMLASQGKRGNPGEPGKPGVPGQPGMAGPAVRALSIDDEGMLTLESADGSKVACDLYPLLSKIAG